MFFRLPEIAFKIPARALSSATRACSSVNPNFETIVD
jgi:hypothetical protein